MVDYYSILLRAVTAPGAGDARWRRDIYERSRQMLATRMRGLRPQPRLAEIAAEEAALEAAIERVESELSWTDRAAARPDEQIDDIAGAPFEPEPGPLAELGFGRTAWIVLAVVVAALGAGGYIFLSGKGQKSAPPQVKAEAKSPATPNAAAPNAAASNAAASNTAASNTAASNTAASNTAPAKLAAVSSAKDGELPPGVDGGSSDPDLQYVFRRQPTFYRTLQPAGTIIVDKLQHFLYLIQPNNVALRYGIAVGAQCADLAGMRHITKMAEWPPWQPPPEMLSRNPNPLPGGPGNPLGARVLQLDDGNSRINGTNAPKTIGNAVKFGCIRLDNDDIVDLYGRVKLSTPVVVY
jgi:lipoprotein-anchoring transpeptidase ErfK/SrfK